MMTSKQAVIFQFVSDAWDAHNFRCKFIPSLYCLFSLRQMFGDPRCVTCRVRAPPTTRTRNILPHCSPAKTGRQGFFFFLWDNPAVTHRHPRSRTAARACRSPVPTSTRREAPLDASGPPVINRSCNYAARLLLRRKSTMTTPDPKDSAGASWHVSEWHIYCQISEPAAQIWTHTRPRSGFNQLIRVSVPEEVRSVPKWPDYCLASP